MKPSPEALDMWRGGKPENGCNDPINQIHSLRLKPTPVLSDVEFHLEQASYLTETPHSQLEKLRSKWARRFLGTLAAIGLTFAMASAANQQSRDTLSGCGNTRTLEVNPDMTFEDMLAIAGDAIEQKTGTRPSNTQLAAAFDEFNKISINWVKGSDGKYRFPADIKYILIPTSCMVL